MSRTLIVAACAAVFSLSTASLAQEMDHSKMTMAAPKGDTGPSSTAFAEANAAMHKGMDIAFSGNADVDFAKGMIAHHQGAIDMAKVELQYGKNEEMRKVAEDVITAQEAEIAMMKDWLAKNEK